MNDSMLLIVGCAAFGLMLVGMIFTVVEFRAVGKKDKRRNINKNDPSAGDAS
jgi:hypothetical protein